VDQKAFAAYVEKYVQEKNATVWKDAIDAGLKNCSVSARKYLHNEIQNFTDRYQHLGITYYVNPQGRRLMSLLF
jgi:hypothetical protein